MPSDIEIVQPLPEIQPGESDERDAFQAQLLAALESPAAGDASVTGSVDALVKLHQSSPDVLKRYLASSPAWRLFEERGGLFATRRWKIGNRWHYEMHGYYSTHDLDPFVNSLQRFQSRLTLGFSGRPWARVNDDCTHLKPAETKKLVFGGLGAVHSRCLIESGDLVVEVFEESPGDERRLTKAALAFLEEELRPLAESPTVETIRRLLPAEKRGRAAMDLRNSFQPGLYDSELWVNPGEPGLLYLRAFEVTKGTPLTTDRLKEYSNERVGWSNDPQELFLSNTHFTIYEGDWGKPYAARFEVWFVPDSGAQERKLLERVFQIEGWQR